MNEINLETIWKHEALNFTPWLSTNQIIPDILEIIYHKPFSLFKTECIVQNYRLDMIYVSQDNYPIIIENQFGMSDNKHLGQNIVYSTLTKIKDVIWICQDVSLEHRNISKHFSDINLIPISFKLFSDMKNSYMIKVHIFGEINSCLTYRLNNDNSISKINN